MAPIMVSLVCESLTFPDILIPSGRPPTPGTAGVDIVEAVNQPDKRKNVEKSKEYILFIGAAANK